VVVATAASPAPAAVKGKRKATPKKGGGSRGPKWRSTEDECLAEAWKTVSIDPISDANQNSDIYWEMVKVSFDERKLMDPTFNKLHMDRNSFRMSHRWGIIQQACNKWHGIQQEVMDRQECGTSIEDLVYIYTVNGTSMSRSMMSLCRPYTRKFIYCEHTRHA
jgi:hypothetical protein